jgi:phosphatidylglycerol:prolipoprotein diacylglycerol transferase
VPIVHHPFEFSLGPLTLTGFGIAMVLAFLIAQHAAETEMARRGYDPKPFADITLGAVVGGLLGAKIYYVILTGAPLFSRDGFVFWGGLMGGILACWLVVRWHKLGFAKMSDLTAPGLAAAYAVGRTGCWAVGDDYGRPWDGPLAVSFPQGAPPSTAENLREFGIAIPADVPGNAVLAVHPTQLYEVALASLMFALLWRWRDHKHAEGWLFGAYCAMAGAERFIIEFFRAKDDRFLGPFTVAQLIATGFVVVGVSWMVARWNTGPGKPGIYAHQQPAAKAARAG